MKLCLNFILRNGGISIASKPKSKTYIVHHRVGSIVRGRYRIGARNVKEAEQLLRNKLGKHITAKVYYEDNSRKTPHGTVELDYPKVEVQTD